MGNLHEFAVEFDNLTHATSAWITSTANHMNLSMPETVSPEAVAGGTAIVLTSVLVCATLVVRITNLLVARRRAKKNARIVQMAEYAPEDDCEEHECETHTTSRTAAPGDSDYEDDSLSTPRKKGPRV